MSLVKTEPPTTYVKKGGRVGRPSTAAKIAKTNKKINEFFPSLVDNNRHEGVNEEHILPSSELHLGDETANVGG